MVPSPVNPALLAPINHHRAPLRACHVMQENIRQALAPPHVYYVKLAKLVIVQDNRHVIHVWLDPIVMSLDYRHANNAPLVALVLVAPPFFVRLVQPVNIKTLMLRPRVSPALRVLLKLFRVNRRVCRVLLGMPRPLRANRLALLVLLVSSPIKAHPLLVMDVRPVQPNHRQDKHNALCVPSDYMRVVEDYHRVPSVNRAPILPSMVPSSVKNALLVIINRALVNRNVYHALQALWLLAPVHRPVSLAPLAHTKITRPDRKSVV